MVALSLLVHGLFLYGVRIKTKALDAAPALTLRATIVAEGSPIPEPKTETWAEPAKEMPRAKADAPAKKIAKAKAKKPAQKKPLPVEAAQEPVSKAPTPEPAPVVAPSPTTETNIVAAEPTLPPTVAAPVNAYERSGAKIRAPMPIENPTMPAEDIVALAPQAVEQPTPIPAIATAPHPLEPVAQDGPSRIESQPAVTSKSETTEVSPPPAKPWENPRESQPAPTPPPAVTNESVAAVAPRETVAAPPTHIDPKALPIPASGEAQYKLRMGLVSGELTLSWKFADGHYRLDSVAQGSGIFAIAGKYIQASEGDVAASGLRPATFSVERRGKKDSAAFNWSDNSVRFSGKNGDRTEAATPGTQDMLSMLFQLAFAPPLGDDLTVIVTNGRKLERYAFERAGEEVLSLEGGKFNTLKISKQRKGDEDGVEVWLALEHHYLPVKIRFTDKKGSVVEQSLMSIKVVRAN